MSSMHDHFAALLNRVNPSQDRIEVASTRVGDVRDWLKEHDFATKDPHTRLSGSYDRKTATADIPDVDVLLFVPDEAEDRTPNAVLLGVRDVLEGYPGRDAAGGISDANGSFPARPGRGNPRAVPTGQ